MLFHRSQSKSGVGQGWQPVQAQTLNRPKPRPRNQDLIESRIVSRLLRSLRRRRIRPLLTWYRLPRAEFFRASSPTNRGIVCFETPQYPLHDSDPPSRALKRPSVQPPKRRDQTSKSPRNSGFPSDRSAPLPERLSTASRQPSGAQPDNGAGASPRDPTPAPSLVVENFGCLALRAKAKRRDKLAISCDDDRAKRSPNDQRSIIGTDPLVTPASRVDGRSPQGRKRTIMARYVFGDELKPGERWKRRLVTTR